MSALGWAALGFLCACVLFAVGMATGASIAVSKRSTRSGDPEDLEAHADQAIALTKENPCPPS